MTKTTRSLAAALALVLAAPALAEAQVAKEAVRPPGGEALKTAVGKERPKAVADVKRKDDIGPTQPRPRPLDSVPGNAISVAFAPDGKTLAVGSDRNLVGLCDPVALRVRNELAGHPFPRVNGLAFSPDGKTLAVANGDIVNQDLPGEVWLWDVGNGAVRARLRGHDGLVWSVAISPDGKLVASGSSDNSVKLWDLATGKEEKFLGAQTAAVRAVAFSPDGKILAAGSFDGTFKLWDVATREVKDCIMAHPGGVNNLAFSPDGKTLVTSEWLQDSGQTSGLKFWDAATLKETKRPAPAVGRFQAIALSPDGRLLATAGGGDMGGELKLWDPTTGGLLWKYASAQPFSGLAFSPDGKSLAASYEVQDGDGEVLIWKVVGRQLRASDRPDPEWAFVDLQPWCNHLLEDDFALFGGNSLRSLPLGETRFAGTKFRVGQGLIRLLGGERDVPVDPTEPQAKAVEPPVKAAPLPDKVKGIKVAAKADRLVFLHGTEFSIEDGGEVGAYVVHYADATEQRVPIVYGRDLADWWSYPGSREPSKAEVAWRGANVAAADFGDGITIRVFSVAWANPHPEKEIATIDFVSKLTRCQPFLVALTVEPPTPAEGKK